MGVFMLATLLLQIFCFASINSDESQSTRKSVFEEVHNPTQITTSMFHKTFHQCSMDYTCNYIVKDVKSHTYNRFKDEQEIPAERSNFVIWSKKQARRGVPGNIAYKKPSSHSSTSTIQEIPLVASFGNDGDRTGDWQRCSITTKDLVPWWQVDLTRQAAVASIQIRNGATWGQLRINPFDISVGDDRSSGGRNNALCVKDGTLAIGELKKFDCPRLLLGRYVTVFLNRQEYLQVCELEVYEFQTELFV
ncbi:fucolectin-1-like isoform X2 [Rhopilema esculentum]|uniref:fucolectin-1-like isoform X2 n=1 Tax=Rhopilema esculentum TaxID=499914 RepID=UPI0031E0C900